MPRPSNFPRWADVDPVANVVEPPENKKNIGWVHTEKPPARFFNWLFYRIYQWIVWLTAQVGSEELRSVSTLTWSGSNLGFSAAIEVVSRVDAAVQINQILPADSPIVLADGEVLVAYLDQDSPSPVTLSAGTYGTLSVGEYAVVDEASLNPDNSENEIILFRRRDVSPGDDEYGVGYAALEAPLTSQLIVNNSRFYLGGKNFDGQDVHDGGLSQWFSDNGVTPTVVIDGDAGTVNADNLPPVGSVIGFWESSEGLGFNPEFWAFMNGDVVSDPESPLDGVTLPDTSGRYLVGFGMDGAGNLGGVAFSDSPVGNANHQVNLQHSHSIPGHSHTVNAHTHSGPSHSHSIANSGSHNHGGRTNGMSVTANEVTVNYRILDNGPGGPQWVNSLDSSQHLAVFQDGDHEGEHDHVISNSGNHNHGGSTGNAGTGQTGSSSPGTNNVPLNSNNSLGTNQSIQPRSIPVRWIMRIK